MNEVLNAIRTRRSVRRYKPDPIPADVLKRIAEAGTWAATGMNRQSPLILVVTDRTLRDRLSAMNAAILHTDTDPFYGAPVVLVVLASKAVPTRVCDGSLVMGNLMLAAHAEGVASCWINRAREEFESEEGKAILKELGIEGDWEGVGHCILGYADGELPAPAPRKPDYVRFV
ncbi:MAG TPA: nitroreductase [Candidatus Fournierella merdigallinarum]|nr:nitroreductase [Candidatus Fournierella merdigallinarum]